MRKRCTCAFSDVQKILIVLVVAAYSQKGLVVKAKYIVTLIGMNCAQCKLKIVTKRDFIAIFFASTRHIASCKWENSSSWIDRSDKNYKRLDGVLDVQLFENLTVC